jgi:hypothetical protein
VGCKTATTTAALGGGGNSFFGNKKNAIAASASAMSNAPIKVLDFSRWGLMPASSYAILIFVKIVVRLLYRP